MSDIKKKGFATEIDKLLGERLRLFRQDLGMSQQTLGQKVGITFQQIQKNENGINRISAVRLFQFSKILNVTMDDFFKGFEDRIKIHRKKRKND